MKKKIDKIEELAKWHESQLKLERAKLIGVKGRAEREAIWFKITKETESARAYRDCFEILKGNKIKASKGVI